MLTLLKVKKYITYCPETGAITKNITGLEEYVLNRDGYRQVWISGKLYLAHRIAVLYMTGKFPEKGLSVDHINRDKLDNRWKNLRVVTVLENNLNKGLQKNNTSGFLGIKKTKHNTFEARIGTGRRAIHIGTFKTIESAVSARTLAEIKYFGKARQT